MKTIQIISCAFLILTFGQVNSSLAQKVATLDSGEQIIIYSDQTWSNLGQQKPAFSITTEIEIVRNDLIDDQLVIELSECGKRTEETFGLTSTPKVTENQQTLEYSIQIGTAVYMYRPKEWKTKGRVHYVGIWYIGPNKMDRLTSYGLALEEAKNLVAHHFVDEVFMK